MPASSTERRAWRNRNAWNLIRRAAGPLNAHRTVFVVPPTATLLHPQARPHRTLASIACGRRPVNASGHVSEHELWAVPEEYNLGASRWVSRTVDGLSRLLHPILAEIRREQVADLPRADEPIADDANLASPLFRAMKIEHQWTAAMDDALAFDVDAFLSQIYETADDFGGQLVSGMFEHISELCDQSGQTVNASGRDIFDAMIEVLEKLDVEFDEEGNHNLTLVLHPNTAKQLVGKKPTPEQEEKLKMLMERKREEDRASRRRRELP